MFVSFIVATRNEEKYIGDLLDSISKQNLDKKSYEVIIIDSSNDKTLEVAKKFKNFINMKIIKEEKKLGSARNLGVERAKGEIIVVADADIKIPANFLNETVKEFSENDDLVALAYPILPSKENKKLKMIYNFSNLMAKFSIKHTTKPFIPATCCAYKKSLFNKLKFVDLVGEDVMFSINVKKFGDAKYKDDIIVYESPRRYEKNGIIKTWVHYTPSTLTRIRAVLDFLGERLKISG